MFKNIKSYGKRVAIEDDIHGEFSYKDLYILSNNLKNKISEKSICLLICGNNIESIVGYLTFMNAKDVVTILIDQSFKIEFINKISQVYKPKYIFAPKIMKFKNFSLKNNFKSYNLHLSNLKSKDKIEYINFLLLPTSGTTQSPKFVRLSKSNLIENSKGIINELNIKKNHTTITTMPMGYSYGLSILNTHLLIGSKIVLNESTIFEKAFWNKIKEKKINSFGGVPEFYDFLRKLKFDQKDLSSIKYITQAGGKLESDTINYLEKMCLKKRINFFKMYGQTEASPRISILKWKFFKRKKDSVGKPLKGCKVGLIDSKGKTINKKNKIGEIFIKGKNVCLGYSKNINDLSKKDINKKRLLTGDLGFIDEDNFIFIVGRKKRFVKLFGIRMEMNDIENILKKNKIKCKCILADH